jgi:hypothetical protein
VDGTVRFAGYVPSRETRPYYALADLFVLPSITTASFKEPWGLVVNEAFNQGVPVIASDAVGAAAGGLVQSGVNGLIVPERDSGTQRGRWPICLIGRICACPWAKRRGRRSLYGPMSVWWTGSSRPSLRRRALPDMLRSNDWV